LSCSAVGQPATRFALPTASTYRFYIVDAKSPIIYQKWWELPLASVVRGRAFIAVNLFARLRAYVFAGTRAYTITRNQAWDFQLPTNSGE
jgi:hypothetical protein